MYSCNELQPVRELALLLALGPFIVVAAVTGWWQRRREAQRPTPVQHERLHSLYTAGH